MTDSKKTIIKQLTGYGIVGLAGTSGHYIVLICIVEFELMPALAATSIGFMIGAFINHILNHIWVFKSKRKLQSTAIQFYAVAVVGFCLNFTVFYVLTKFAVLQYLFAQIVATGCVFISTFLANRLWTFAKA